MWGVRGFGIFGFIYIFFFLGRCVIIIIRFYFNGLVMEVIEVMKFDKILKVGGVGYKVLLLFEGIVDVYVFVSLGCKRWDICVCEVFFELVGGILIDVCGEYVIYDFKVDSYVNKIGVLGSLKDYKFYVDMILEFIKSNLRGKL